jgi:hypothetical protein
MQLAKHGVFSYLKRSCLEMLTTRKRYYADYTSDAGVRGSGR